MATFVSVVVPTHNRPEMLAEALASGQAQTFTDYEIIVVSNGENDEMRGRSQTVATLHDARWFALPEGNVSAARNFGIERAKGEWIAFLDDDDIWLPAKLERQILEAHRTGADLIACDTVNFFPDGSESAVRMRLPAGRTYLEALCRQKWWGPVPSAVMVRKTVFDDIGGFDPNLQAREDSDLLRRISWRHAIFQMDEVLVRYRAGHPSLSRDMKKARSNELRHYIKIWRDTPRDLRWALPNPATLPCRWLSQWCFPAWLRQPRKHWIAMRQH